MFNQIETEIHCPYCNESISVLVDPSIEQQSYIEDCQVCCRPIEFSVVINDDELSRIDVRRDDE